MERTIHIPTPGQIQRDCAAVQEGWSEAERRKRRNRADNRQRRLLTILRLANRTIPARVA